MVGGLTTIPAQEYQELLLQYSEGNRGVRIIDNQQYEYIRYPGIGIRPGDTLTTVDNRVELSYKDIEGILKLNLNSTLQTLSATETGRELPTALELLSGELRLTLARYSQQVQIHTKLTKVVSSGADLIIEYQPRQSHTVTVYGGSATITNKITNEQSIIAAGCRFDFYGLENYITAFDDPSGSDANPPCEHSVPPQRLTELFSNEVADELRHVSGNEGAILSTLLDRSSVAQLAPPPPQQREEEEVVEQQEEDEEEVQEEELVEETTEESEEEEEEKKERERTNTYFYVGLDGGVMSYEQRLTATTGAIAGFESPIFGVGINAPLQYAINPFDPNSWYQYRGSHNWSFGGGNDPAGDVIRDIITKFEFLYLSLGDENLGLNLNAGALEDVTLGLGTLVRNYTNALDLPLQYNVGAQLELAVPFLDITLFTNDVSRARLFGGRVQFQAGSFSAGIELIADWGLAETLNASGILGETQASNNLTVAVASLDVATRVTEGQINLIPFLQGAFFFPGILSPFQFDLQNMLRQDGIPFINNFLFGAGVDIGLPIGSLLAALYGWSGIADPFIFDSTYERSRIDLAQDVQSVLTNTADSSLGYINVGVGVALELELIKDLMRMKASYLLPMRVLSPFQLYGSDDRFGASLIFSGKLIPGFEIGARYSRKGFMNTILGTNSYEGASILDGNSTYGAFINYTFGDFLTVGGFFSSSTLRQANGEPQFTSANRANSQFTFGATVRFHPRFYLPDIGGDSAETTNGSE